MLYHKTKVQNYHDITEGRVKVAMSILEGRKIKSYHLKYFLFSFGFKFRCNTI